MIFRHKFINVLLAADGGTEGAGTDGGGAPATEGGEGSTPDTSTEQETQYEKPKYFAQITPEKADSDSYKGLYKYQKIDDLADAYIAQSKDFESMKEKYKDSIVVPKADDAEGIKTFKGALGIPETADGYTLSTLKDSKLDDATKKMIRETAYGAMLSDKQAEAIGVVMLKTAKIAAESMKAQRESAIKTFDTTLTASYSDIANEADRKSTAERDKASYEHFMNESGLKDYLNDRGLSYDPTFVKGIAAYARKHTGAAPQSNLPTTPPKGEKRTTGMNEAPSDFYGNAFNDAYKK